MTSEGFEWGEVNFMVVGELLAIVSTGAEIACDLCHGLAKSFAD